MSKNSTSQQSGRFGAFAELAAYLDGLGLFRMTPGLERIRSVLDRLNLRRPPFTVAQIVGTNGKGSTSTMLASLGFAHGLKTGLGTSPHFVSVRERIKIDGRLLPEETWVTHANKLMDAGGKELSYFEFIVALSVVAFAAEGVQLAVMETGLGGSWDATTALEADLVVFTPISLDHTQILGESISEIARDKAGAIRAGKPAITVGQPPEVMAEIAAAAEKNGSALYLVADAPAGADATNRIGCCPHTARLVNLSVPERPRGEKMLLSGDFQRQNAALALASWRFVNHMLSEKKPQTADRQNATQRMSAAAISPAEAKGLCSAWIPGRMHLIRPQELAVLHAGRGESAALKDRQRAEPFFLLDGAHNCHGLSALGLALAKSGIAPSATIFACLEDKYPEQMAAHLRALSTGPIFIPPIKDNPRAVPPGKLAGLIGLNASPAGSLHEAVRLAVEHVSNYAPAGRERAFALGGIDGAPAVSPGVILLCGSLYLLGEFYAMFPQTLNTPQKG